MLLSRVGRCGRTRPVSSSEQHELCLLIPNGNSLPFLLFFFFGRNCVLVSGDASRSKLTGRGREMEEELFRFRMLTLSFPFTLLTPALDRTTAPTSFSSSPMEEYTTRLEDRLREFDFVVLSCPGDASRG